jgi:hypothetical protein
MAEHLVPASTPAGVETDGLSVNANLAVAAGSGARI